MGFVPFFIIVSVPHHMNIISQISILQTDLEDAKAQETAQLQEALHAMKLQLEEAKVMVIKEREAARKAIEEAPPIIKETPVIIQDTKKIDSLTTELETAKVRFCSLKQRVYIIIVITVYYVKS